MDLPALFSLISAAILGLLPVLLLFGRRRMQRRTRSRERSTAELAEGNETSTSDSSQSTGRKPSWGGAARPMGREDAQTGERELRDAAIIAGVTPPGPTPGRRADRGTAPAPTARSVSATGIGTGAHGRTGRAAGQTIEERLAHLTPLQRAIAYSEILGRPAALREPGRRDRP